MERKLSLEQKELVLGHYRQLKEKGGFSILKTITHDNGIEEDVPVNEKEFVEMFKKDERVHLWKKRKDGREVEYRNAKIGYSPDNVERRKTKPVRGLY